MLEVCFRHRNFMLQYAVASRACVCTATVVRASWRTTAGLRLAKAMKRLQGLAHTTGREQYSALLELNCKVGYCILQSYPCTAKSVRSIKFV